MALASHMAEKLLGNLWSTQGFPFGDFMEGGGGGVDELFDK